MIIHEGRTRWTCDVLDQYIPGDGKFHVDRHQVGSEEDHNLISSLTIDGDHMPAIDLDIPHSYLASSTEGHGHLFLDVPMSWDKYSLLLMVLLDCGIIERGFYENSMLRKASFLRAPGVHKESVD